MSDPKINPEGTPPAPAAGTTPPGPAPALPGTPGRPAAAAFKPVAPAAKPAAALAKPAGKTRRGILGALVGSWFAVGMTTMVASLGAMTFGFVRFLFPNVLVEPPSRVKVGFPDQFEEGKVDERFKDQNIWVVRNKGVIYALSTTCTHLGCTPNWLEREGKFKCPCHGSGFKMSGVNFEGPAPRPLERWGISVAEDGQILVDKGKKFQQERGEWTNPESYLKA